MGFLRPLLDRAQYDEAWGIDEAKARVISRRLAKEEGGLRRYIDRTERGGGDPACLRAGPGHRVATVACDSGLKYLAGDLYQV